jgi:hypothetical protein
MDRYRVLVTGCRHWNCTGLAGSIVNRLMERHGTRLVVVHGAARGVDSAFAEACNDLGVEHEPHPADWNTYGRGAGPRRNAEMVAAGANLCLAVHRDLKGSKGTLDCTRRAIAAGIPTYLIDNDRDDVPMPKRITEV